ncbi:hypothetical protein QVD17_32999 [Tagetes erecta]|uniref:Uncharacterized protein n=1 Tax=Tagetes erecta TaxID=13708 RepID=A0AAD8K2Q3_TARER|nr:hypothetical protein QVD17_32999 [Tagetes erecta]
MGNYASACTLMISPPMKTNKAARVIFPSGEIRQLREPIKAAEIMFESPGFFLVNSRSLNINRRFSPLSADEELERGNVYIMFPMRRVNSVITPADMAVFWMGGNSAGRRIAGRISPEVNRPTEACGDGVEVAETPEFGYRVAVCRSKKPSLDTIAEEPVGKVSKSLAVRSKNAHLIFGSVVKTPRAILVGAK